MSRRKSKFDPTFRDTQRENFELPDQLPNDVEEHQFSKRHEETMRKLFRGEEIPPDPITKEVANLYTSREISFKKRLLYRGKRSISIAAMMLVLVCITITSYKGSNNAVANQIPLVNVVIEWFSNSMGFRVDTKETENIPEKLETIYEPQWVPKGYTKKEYYLYSDCYKVIYSKEGCNDIIYKQYTIYSFTKDDLEKENFVKKQEKGIVYYISEKESQTTIFRFDERYRYCVIGELSKKNIQKMLKNLTSVELKNME